MFPQTGKRVLFNRVGVPNRLLLPRNDVPVRDATDCRPAITVFGNTWLAADGILLSSSVAAVPAGVLDCVRVRDGPDRFAIAENRDANKANIVNPYS